MGDNPYEAPTTAAAPIVTRSSRDTLWVRTIFYTHLVTVIAGAFVIRSESVFSHRYLELLIVLPLVSTLFVCPLAMIIAAIVLKPTTMRLRVLAVGGDLVLSAIQILVWLPTVQ